MMASVLVEIKSQSIDKMFSYNIPDNLLDKVFIGSRVLVPFGNRKLEGFVLKTDDNIDLPYDIKDIIDVTYDKPVLNEEMIKLGEYMSKKTLSNLISCYQTMLPLALKAKVKLTINKKYEVYLKLVDLDYIPSNTSQEEIINILKNNDLVLKSTCNNISSSSVKTLLNKGIIVEIKKECFRYNSLVNSSISKVNLTDEQQSIVDTVINDLKFIPYLLFGVTGSGKTEVYMSVIEFIIKSKKTALVLVPEISLTPQFIDKFKNRFGDNIAVLHSKLSDGERYDEWRKIEDDKVSIVIGARSAVFAPLKNIGVIIIDEEHSDTYKQENNPKYNAIDIGLYRAKYHNCPIVLGSATPSIESYTRASTGVYKLLELKKRVNNKLPLVKLIDMKDEIKNGNKIISKELDIEIRKNIENNEQTILLLNRRGYSTVINCQNCGYVEKCPKCDIPLIYHKKNNVMNCHYCGYNTYKIKCCPDCKSSDINDLGLGTEKLEQIIKDNYSGAKVIRMDVDTTSKKGAHEKIIKDFSNEDYNILIGTQMVAKGLDFPRVTLVGVLNGDSTLNIPDFRSAERTYSLLNQVSGRAGRSRTSGRVIIQGFNIYHYSILYSSEHDYISFYKKELDIRKKLNYPPYYNLCLIKISSKDLNILDNESLKIKSYLVNNLNKENIILGPSSCSMPKINNIYYVQIIIKFKKTDKIIDTLLSLKKIYNSKKNIKLEIDLNPLRI